MPHPGRIRSRPASSGVFVPTSFRSGIAGAVRSLSSETGGPPLRRQAEAKERTTMTGYVGRIESETLKNTYFRQVLFTGKHAQVVVMCLQPGEDIGKEVHPNVDRFFRIEQGEAKFVFNETEEHLVRDPDAVVLDALMTLW